MEIWSWNPATLYITFLSFCNTFFWIETIHKKMHEFCRQIWCNNSFTLPPPTMMIRNFSARLFDYSHFHIFSRFNLIGILFTFWYVCFHQLCRSYLSNKIVIYSQENENHLEWILSIDLMRWSLSVSGTAELKIFEMTEFRRCETIATSQ